jgi:hypothetical protein
MLNSLMDSHATQAHAHDMQVITHATRMRRGWEISS